MKENNVKKLSNTVSVRNTTILASFIIGWAITIAGFIVPPLGVIDNSVLIVLGQSLTFVATGLSIKWWTDIQNTKIDNLINKK